MGVSTSSMYALLPHGRLIIDIEPGMVITDFCPEAQQKFMFQAPLARNQLPSTREAGWIGGVFPRDIGLCIAHLPPNNPQVRFAWEREVELEKQRHWLLIMTNHNTGWISYGRNDVLTVCAESA